MTNLTDFIQSVSCIDVNTAQVNFVSKQCCILIFIFCLDKGVLKVAVLKGYKFTTWNSLWYAPDMTYIHSLYTWDMLMVFITGIQNVHHSLPGTVPHDCAYCAACASTL
jgi:hypothetical protein